MDWNKLKGKRLKWKGVRVFCLVSCLLVLGSAEGKAQTFAEWFDQKSTLMKYLAKQIAFVGIYEVELKQGYNEAKSGLRIIGGFKNGELGLHSDYYTALIQVKPEVKAAADLGSVRGEVQVVGQQFSGLRSLPGLNAEEQVYVNAVGAHVLAGCNQELEALSLVLSSGRLSMTDAERIMKVKDITASLQEAYVFACSFCGQVRLLAGRRLKDGQEASGLGKLYGEE